MLCSPGGRLDLQACYIDKLKKRKTGGRSFKKKNARGLVKVSLFFLDAHILNGRTQPDRDEYPDYHAGVSQEQKPCII